MANKGFNNSTVIFANVTIGSLRGIHYSRRTPKANVSDSDDTSGTQVVGVPIPSVTVDVVGGVLPTATSGALTITWFDSTTIGTLSNVQVGDMSVDGTMDGEITASIEFVSAPS